MGLGQALSVALSAADSRLSRRALGRLAIGQRRRDLDAVGRPQPATRQAVSGALTSPNVYDLAISPASNDIVFAATGDDARSPDRSGVYRSTDGTQTWSCARKTFLVSQLAQAPDDPKGRRLFHPVQPAATSGQMTDTVQCRRSRLARRDRRISAERWVYAVGTGVVFARRRRHLEQPGGEVEGPDARPDKVRRPTGGARRSPASSDTRTSSFSRTDFSVWAETSVPADPVLDAARAQSFQRADR